MADYYGNGYSAGQDSNVMDWDDVIQNDGAEFVVLEPGDYVFEVVDFERGRFPGGPKIPACNKATVTLQVKTQEGITRVRTDLLLYRTLEWKISAFFRCIGQKKHGERLTMDWNHIIGMRGRARFKIRNYTDKDGNERQTNEVDRFYDFDEEKMPDVGSGFMEMTDSDDELPFD
ncbi:MAG: hypothetical protein K6G66_01270 [Oscillospiraceae bacterium]|nr:hypothetical protein [Oscillospiraceae bacterium]